MKVKQKITTQKPQLYKDYEYLGEKRQRDLRPQPQRSDETLLGEQKEERKASTKIGFYLSTVALGIVMLTLATLLFWSFDTDTVLEIKNGPVSVRPTEIDREQYIILHYDYCKHSDAEGKVEAALVSKTAKILLPDAEDRTGKSCKVFDVPYPIPGQTPPGKYHYEFKACYQLNLLKQSCTEWRSREFTVKADEFEKDVETTNQ